MPVAMNRMPLARGRLLSPGSPAAAAHRPDSSLLRCGAQHGADDARGRSRNGRGSLASASRDLRLRLPRRPSRSAPPRARHPRFNSRTARPVARKAACKDGAPRASPKAPSSVVIDLFVRRACRARCDAHIRIPVRQHQAGAALLGAAAEARCPSAPACSRSSSISRALPPTLQTRH